MDDLVQFLRDCLDEDEREAKAQRGIFPSPGVQDDGYVWLHIRPGGNAVITRYPRPVEGYDDMAKLRNWADTENGWTQARVLREVDAKRRILDAYENYDNDAPELDVPESVLRLLALPYADHPDYRDGWRP